MADGPELLFVLERDTVRDYALRYLDTEKGAETLKEYPDNREFIATGYDEDPGEWDQVACDYVDELIGDRLTDAYLRLLESRFTDVTLTPGAHCDFYKATTPVGRHEFAPFHVGYFSAEDGPVTYGISLWGRYFPTWLDWRFPTGGSWEPLIFDNETTLMVDQARTEIARIIPEINAAPVGIVMVHY